MTVPRVLVIAGSDSGGGAGIQADIKAITALGGHAMTAITAITAQNTLGVSAVEALSPALVVAQIDAVLADMGADAVKIGMLGSAAIARAVAERLAGETMPIVVDPVMVATSGAGLADDDTIAAMTLLMDQAALITPNLPELQRLADGDGAVLARRHRAPVLIKGGHGEGALLVDRLLDAAGDEIACWEGSRIETSHTHGTGCSLASGIAAGLAAGLSLPEAVARARLWVRAAIAAAPGLGQGAGPIGVPAERFV